MRVAVSCRKARYNTEFRALAFSNLSRFFVSFRNINGQITDKIPMAHYCIIDTLSRNRRGNFVILSVIKTIKLRKGIKESVYS